MQKLRQISIRLALTFRVSILFVLVFFSSLAVYTYTRTIDAPKTYAATSSTLNFQGRLLNASGSIVPDGFYNIEFKLYDGGTQGGPGGVGEANAGTLLWTETRDFPGTDDRVRVVNGYFSVSLGSVSAFTPGTINWDQELWLTMNVGGSGTTPAWDGEMLAPTNKRTKLTSVPYAFTAGQLLKTVGTNKSILDFLSPTANRTINLPDQSGTLCVQGSADCVDVVTTSTTATISRNSGLEISSDGLRLLGGCTNGQILKWNNTSSVWQCDTDNGSPLNIRETDGTPSNSGVGTLEFGPVATSSDEFIITDQGSGVTRVRIGNGVALLADNETVAGAWTYSTDQTLNLDNAEDLAINLTVLGVGNAQAETITLTNNSILGNQYGLYIDNAIGLGTTEALVVLDNSDAVNPVTVAIKLINAGGGFTNLFDVAGTLISTAEISLLDGRDGALVDTNDAVNTGITGTGALDAGSITANFGSINVGVDDITTTGTVLANNFDRTSAGALAFGNTNATSVSLCNSATCDTISLGVNTDADTIQIGESNDTITVGGTSASFTLDSAGLDVTSAGALSGITTLVASGAINAATSTNTINGLIVNSGALSSITGFTQGSGNFSQSGTGTFSTGSGSVNLNGATTVTNGTNSATSLTVNGTTGTAATALNVVQTGNAANMTLSNTARTSGALVSLTQSTSAFTGTGLLFDFASGSGSFASGNFLDFQLNGISRFRVDNTGALAITTDSATGLNVLSTAGLSYFSVDVANSAVRVGSATADANGILLVLDTKNTAGDPTGVNGGSYYNSNTGKFRCYEATVWKDCITPDPNTAIFEDTTSAAFAGDNQTTQLFNDATKPNIVTKYTTSTVQINVHVSGVSNTANDAFFAVRVVFTTDGVDPSCSTSSQVGRSMISGFTTAGTHPYQMAGSFVHNPGVSGTIKYTVCSSDDAMGATLTDTPDNLTISLVELGF